MRKIFLFVVLSFVLIAVPLLAQDLTREENQTKKGTATITGVVLRADGDCGCVIDKKFIVVSAILAGSTVLAVETGHHFDPKNPFFDRNIYVFHGISDLSIIALSALFKTYDKKWWWVMPIGVAGTNGWIAVKYNLIF